MAGVIIAPGSNSSGAAGSSTTITQSATYTAGDKIIVWVKWSSNSITCTLADGTHTFNQIGGYGDDTNGVTHRFAMFEANNVAGGSFTITATFSSTVTNRAIAYYRGTGLKNQAALTGIAFNNQEAATSATDNVTSASFSPSAQPNTIFAVTVTKYNARTVSAGTNYTSLGAITGYDGILGDTSLAEWRNTTSTSSQAATFTLSGGDGVDTVAVSFEDASTSPATLSAATPSGTIGTSTTATIGATTDQTTGTFYAVVGTGSQLTGVTATQIKAGQKADGSAALASNNSAVSTTSPSTGVTGLSAATAYTYAAVQNNANGDSNIVTGSFTTATGSSPVLGESLTSQTFMSMSRGFR